jgi:hypothetical protein
MRLKGAALCFGALLVTPFVLSYDLMLLAPALLLLAAAGLARGGQPFQTSLLVLLWAMPLAAVSLARLGLPMAVWTVAAGFVFSLRTPA